ncbi:hypothetical protein FVA95_21305 [Pseudonocardia sp. EV170527-09]|uniref:hypothetical protein n=1 Tax=Pseudonocardia sp. EV170527-09 TaxID=2603411 RepID=UPI0011F2DA0E|nr:hypothetical protein [Pseudonocardia sp. EV170527-09]KAA1020488.1 hypothetical protein FVA95_21305 [Pseudonocardia sp. EV170527-09]
MTAPLLAGPALAHRVALVLAVPLQAALGARPVDDADPAAGVAFEIGELADGGAGGAHAGALAVGLEVGALLAVLPHLTEAEHAVSVSTAVTLPAQAPRGGEVAFRGTLDRRTGRSAFTSVTAVCAGVVVARAQIVKAVVRVQPA